MATTTAWRGITTDPETARYLTAVAAEVTRMTKAAGVPDFTVTPIPGCGSYQTSTTASAGTHAGGGAVDINAEPLTDRQARILESAARKCGGTAWFRPRTSPTGFVYGWQRHVHILRTDCGDLASPSATGQVKDYRAGLNGLANKGPDTGDRSWVSQTWAAYQELATAVTDVAGAVIDTAQESFMSELTPAEQRNLYNIVTGRIQTRNSPDGKPAKILDGADGNYIVGILRAIAAKVGAPVDVDESAIAKQLLAGLAPAVSAAVKSAVAAGVPTADLADAVVARLGERLAQP